MAIDFDAIKRRLDNLSGANSKRNVMWRPTEGETHTVRILAFTDNDGMPFKDRYFYYNIGNNPGLLAPYQFGQPDPINEVIQQLKSQGTKEGYEMAKKLYPKMRTYAAVIVRGEEEEGVKLWAFGKTVYQNLLNLMLDSDYGDITDPLEGHDIKVTCSKQAGKMFAMTDVMPRPKSTPLGTKKQIKEWTESIPDLDAMYTCKSYEQLETIINAWLNDDQSDESDDTTTGTVSQGTTQTQSGNVGSLDDAFADLGSDIPF